MVQLKAIEKDESPALRIAFQFQYGTIKSTKMPEVIINGMKFQFQYGTIKSLS